MKMTVADTYRSCRYVKPTSRERLSRCRAANVDHTRKSSQIPNPRGTETARERNRYNPMTAAAANQMKSMAPSSHQRGSSANSAVNGHAGRSEAGARTRSAIARWRSADTASPLVPVPFSVDNVSTAVSEFCTRLGPGCDYSWARCSPSRPSVHPAMLSREQLRDRVSQPGGCVPEQPEVSPSLAIGHYLVVLRRRWRVVLAVVIVGLIAAIVYLQYVHRQS